MAVLFSPWGNQQFFDESGNPATGWKIYSYVAGSSTALATYTTSAGSVSQSNPIVLDALGFATGGQVWLTSGLSYKLVLTDANGVVKKTEDNITGVASSSSADQWATSGLTPTYISATSFTLAGDQTSAFHIGRRIKATVTAGTVYGTITASAFSALTTVTLEMDSGNALDSGLTAVSYSLLSKTNDALPRWFSPEIRSISASVAANALTITLAPTSIDFRSATLGSGTVTNLTSAATPSLVIPSGATLGASNGVAARYWVATLGNAGTAELAVMNTQLANGQIAPVNEAALISTTLLDTSSDSAGVWYSAAARTGVAFRLVGYFDHTQATAGTYATAPSFIQGMGPGVRRPGDVVQEIPGILLTSGSASSNIPFDDTIPQSSEGALILTQAIVPTSALNYIEVDADVVVSEVTNTSDFITAAVFRDSGVDAIGASFTSGANLGDNITAGRITFTTPRQRAGSTASTDLKLRVGTTSGDVRWNGYSTAGRKFGGVMPSALRVREIQV